MIATTADAITLMLGDAWLEQWFMMVNDDFVGVYDG